MCAGIGYEISGFLRGRLCIFANGFDGAGLRYCLGSNDGKLPGI